MAKYLNPKADLTFKKVFGEHKEQESGYTDAELLAIDKYWDQISRERTAVNAAERKGRAEGLAEGVAKGRAEGEQNKAMAIAKAMLNKGMSVSDIAELTGLRIEDILS